MDHSFSSNARDKVSRWSYAAMIKEETNLYSLRVMQSNYKWVVSVCHATASNAFGLDAIPLSLWNHQHTLWTAFVSEVSPFQVSQRKKPHVKVRATGFAIRIELVENSVEKDSTEAK